MFCAYQTMSGVHLAVQAHVSSKHAQVIGRVGWQNLESVKKMSFMSPYKDQNLSS